MSDKQSGPNGLCLTTNSTIIDGFNITCEQYLTADTLCTIQTCPLSLAQITYIPTLEGNVLYVALFGVMLLAQIFLGIRYRTWGFLGGMMGGLVLEILGYVARVLLNDNPFSGDWFKIYLIGLTIAPAFLSASIYICLARIIVIFGRNLSRFRPAFYTIAFICFDLFSLILQAVGGALASTAETPTDQDTGVNIMIAGLSAQVVSLFIFMALCADFAIKVYRNRSTLDPTHSAVRGSWKFKAFLLALLAATILIFVRSTFRVAELQEGFDGELANEEITFMILEGAMIVLAVGALTFMHPGVALGETWHKATFALRPAKDRSLAMDDLAVGAKETA